MTLLFFIPDPILAPLLVIAIGIVIYRITYKKEKPKSSPEKDDDFENVVKPWTTFHSNGKKVS